MIQFGVFSGRRAKWAAVLLGVLVTIDLARSDVPWIQHYDYRDQYVSNPILDVLKDKSFEHRTVVFPLQLAQAIAARAPRAARRAAVTSRTLEAAVIH